MGFLTSLFGGGDNIIVTVILALGIVLVLIVLGVWLLKLIFNATGKVGRTRNRRLNVIDTMAIDQKRQLILIRRDDVDHLLLVGGPQDVVVETGITPPAEPEPIKKVKSRGIAPIPVPGMQANTASNEAATEPKQQRRGPFSRAQTAPASDAVTLPEADTTEPKTETPPRRKSLRHTGLLRSSSRVEPEISIESSTPESVIEKAVEADSANTVSEPSEAENKSEGYAAEKTNDGGEDHSTDSKSKDSEATN